MRPVDTICRLVPGKEPVVLALVIGQKIWLLHDLEAVREEESPDGRHGLCYQARIGKEVRKIYLIDGIFWLEERNDSIFHD